jgi:acyl-CoA reductase-like NAD-dependent aldehyde dehydrogenase
VAAVESLQFAKQWNVLHLCLQDGIQKIAEPIGIIAGIVPTTNPTSTVIFKCLLALKTRCAAAAVVGPASAMELTCMVMRLLHKAVHTEQMDIAVADFADGSKWGLSWCLGVYFRMCLCLSTCRACTCRNAIVLSPHVRAAKCSIAAASIVREAAERAGAPPGLIQWIDKPSLVLATALMKDPKINLILATGG